MPSGIPFTRVEFTAALPGDARWPQRPLSVEVSATGQHGRPATGPDHRLLKLQTSPGCPSGEHQAHEHSNRIRATAFPQCYGTRASDLSGSLGVFVSCWFVCRWRPFTMGSTFLQVRVPLPKRNAAAGDGLPNTSPTNAGFAVCVRWAAAPGGASHIGPHRAVAVRLFVGSGCPTPALGGTQ